MSLPIRNTDYLVLDKLKGAEQGKPKNPWYGDPKLGMDVYATVAPPAPKSEQQILFDRIYERGQTLYMSGKYDEAIECFDKALTILPEHSSFVNTRKGMCLGNLGKHHQAIECFNKALAGYWRDVFNLYNKGIALYYLGKYDEAIECFDRILWDDSYYGKSEVWNNKGIALYYLGRYDRAIECFDKALNEYGGHADAAYNKSTCLEKLGKYDESISFNRPETGAVGKSVELGRKIKYYTSEGKPVNE